VVNASFAAAIESELPTEAAFETIGSKNVGEAVTEYATTYLGAVAQYADSAKHMHIDGVKIPHFFPGTKLNLTPMGSPGGVGQDFEASLLRYIAANLGVSYEQISKDYAKTNYSSARAGMLETWKYMQARKRTVADKFASVIYKLWLEEALGKGMISSMPNSGPNFYEGLNGDAYAGATWLGAGFGMIDELKETQAATLRIKTHLSTLEREYARQGLDWRHALRQIARERTLMTELEIPLPEEAENNTENAITGAVRESSTGDAESPGGTEE
jgi:lambda family phage portal protein